MDIAKHLNEEAEYIKIIKIAGKILDNFNDLKSVDRNDVYDIIYCKQKLTNMIESGLENKDIEADAKDLTSRIDVMLQSINESTLKDILDRHIKDNREVNKTKYNNKNKYCDMEYKGNKTDTVFYSPLSNYFRSKFPKLLTLVASLLVLLVWPSISNLILGDVTSANNPNAVAFSNLLALICTITRLFVMVAFVVSSLLVALDLMYISFPFLRESVENKETKETLISTEAIEAVKTEGYITISHKLNTNDRFEVAENMVELLTDELEEYIRYVHTYDADVTFLHDDKIKILKDMYTDVQAIKGRLKIAKLRNRIEALVEAEIMYEKLENFRDWHKKHMESLDFEAYPV